MSLSPTAARIREWREGRGILKFVADNFGVTPDPWQEQALIIAASPKPQDRRLSLQACAGPGKTAVLAWIGWWFLSVQGERGEHPKGLATSVTGDNLKANLWPELAKWQERSPFLRFAFTWMASKIVANGHEKTWVLEARSYPKTANPEEQGRTFSGLHSKYAIVLVDESGSIPATVLRTAEQIFTTAVFGKVIQAGNPISLEGMLYAAATRLRHQWRVVRITGDPEDPKRSTRVDTEWAQQQIDTYGRDNPWVKAYILGEFPNSSINSLLGVEDVEAAMNRVIRPEDYQFMQKRLGVDVARFGDDRNVIFPRQGLMSWAPTVKRNIKSTIMAAAVAMAQDNWTRAKGSNGIPPNVYVDDTGHWGHAVIDLLTDQGRPAYPVVFSDRAIDPRFFNRRAEMHMTCAEWVKNGGALPDMPELVGELTSMTYTLDGGKFRLEEKSQIKKRIGKSPDLADGLALTFAFPDSPEIAQRRRRGKGPGSVKIDFDPYAERGRDDVNDGRALTDFDPFASEE